MGRTMRTAGAALVAGALLVGLGACGDDDDDSEATGDESTDVAGDDGGSTAEFCEAAVAVDATNLAAESDEASPEDVDTAMQEALDLAPEAIASDVEVLVTEAREMAAQPETEEGPPPIPSDEFFASSVAVGDYMTENCDVEPVEVTADEYAFEGFPETVPAGTALVALSNAGTEYHEVALMRIADGETRSIEELLALPEEEVGTVVTSAGFVFAPPGQASYVTADLEPGRYAALCFVPVGATPEALESGAALDEADMHAMHGMVAEFEVE